MYACMQGWDGWMYVCSQHLPSCTFNLLKPVFMCLCIHVRSCFCLRFMIPGWGGGMLPSLSTYLFIVPFYLLGRPFHLAAFLPGTRFALRHVKAVGSCVYTFSSLFN